MSGVHCGRSANDRYAGHTDTTGPATTTYIKADLQTVATALAVMTGQPHPLPRASGIPTACSEAPGYEGHQVAERVVFARWKSPFAKQFGLPGLCFRSGDSRPPGCPGRFHAL